MRLGAVLLRLTAPGGRRTRNSEEAAVIAAAAAGVQQEAGMPRTGYCRTHTWAVALCILFARAADEF